jgi:hypothetical protein
MKKRKVEALLVAIVVGACAGAASCSKHGGATAASDGGTDATPPPPRVCKTPTLPPPYPWFTDVTNEIGLGTQTAADGTTFTPIGSSVVSADFDGDGYADLLAQGAATSARGPAVEQCTGIGGTDAGSSDAGPLCAVRDRFLMMNRPDPNDPTKRVFVDVPDLGGLLATRDGKGGRGASIAILGDLNNDGAIDVVTCPSDFTVSPVFADPCGAFLNDGTGHFTLAPQSALDAKPYPATSAVVLDWNRDGILDFWPAGMANWPYMETGDQWDTGPQLFQGAGDGTFTNETKAARLPTADTYDDSNDTSLRSTFGMTTCDIDGDGDIDVLTASYGREENWIFRNDGDHFTEVGHLLGLDHDDREDYSDDQSYRCYCAWMQTCKPMPPAPVVPCNAFGRPDFRGWAPGQSDKPWHLGGNNFGVTCGDINDDGFMDVMFATVVHADVGSSSDPTEIAVNPGDGTKFRRPGDQATGLTRPPLRLASYDDNFGDNEPFFVDVDLDGRKDIYVTSTVYPQSRPWFWRQKDDGTFEEVGIPAGLAKKIGTVLGITSYEPITQGIDFVDFDGDGDLDLVTGSQEKADQLHAYRNDVGQDSNWIRVRLVGAGAGASNVAAIGARVSVTAGGRTQTLEVKGGEGIGAIQNDFVLTFGLGATCDIDHIDVRWADSAGTTVTFPGVLANYTVTLREGSTDVQY